MGHWEGDTLVVDTTNLNGKTWMNEVGDVVSYAEHAVERFIPGMRRRSHTGLPSRTRLRTPSRGPSKFR